MTAINDRSNALAFAAEGMAGSAGAAALRQTRTLLDRAPSGRLFGTIATLTELSGRATSQLEQGKLAAAIGTLDQLATAATPAAAEMPDIPLYLKKRG
jgi:hypothetical protein